MDAEERLVVELVALALEFVDQAVPLAAVKQRTGNLVRLFGIDFTRQDPVPRLLDRQND